MNKVALEARIELLTVEMNRLKDTYKVLEGHLAETQHWHLQLTNGTSDCVATMDNLNVKESENGEVDNNAKEQTSEIDVCGS